MSFLFTTLKISLIIFVASHIATAGPVGSGLSAGGGKASGGSVSSSDQAAGGDSLLPGLGGLDLLELLSGNGGDGGEAGPRQPVSYSKGVGGSSLAGTRFRQGNTVSQSGAFSGPAQGGSVIGGKGLLNILAGNGGEGGEYLEKKEIFERY